MGRTRPCQRTIFQSLSRCGVCQKASSWIPTAPQEAFDALLLALGEPPKLVGSKKALAGYTTLANIHAPHSMGTDPDRLGDLLATLARYGGKSVALSIAKKIASPARLINMAYATDTSSKLVDVLSACMEQGVTLHAMWSLDMKPGHSLGEQARFIVDSMAPSCVRAYLDSVISKQEIAASISSLGEPRDNAPWLVAGLAAEDAGSVAEIVDFLNKLHPGEGAKIALECLRSHPEVAQALALSREHTEQAGSKPPARKRL